MNNDQLQWEAGEDRKGDLVEEHKQKLQNYFDREIIEWNGVAVTDDNYEEKFENWLDCQDLTDLTNIINN